MNIGIRELTVVPLAPDRVRAEVRINRIANRIPSSASGCNRVEARLNSGTNRGNDLFVRLDMFFLRNAQNNNTQLFVSGQNVAVGLGGLDIDLSCEGSAWDCAGCTLSSWLVEGIINGLSGFLVDQIQGAVGTLTCRGCNANTDCGQGGTCSGGSGSTRYCRDGSNRPCQNVELGAQVLIDAGGLLSSIAPGTEGRLGVLAFANNQPGVNFAFNNQANNNGGLNLYARVGATADPASLCVPFQASPLSQAGTNCTNSLTCPALSDLTGVTTTPAGQPFHIGVGVARGAVDQILWSAYNSGALCLTLNLGALGIEGFDLSTGFLAPFISSINPLTENTPRDLTIQLRPQSAPYVRFEENDPDLETNGAVVVIHVDNAELDFYTLVNERNVRFMTLRTSLEVPLGLNTFGSTVEIVLGDLGSLLKDSVVLNTNGLINEAQAQGLIDILPGLIGSLGGDLLGDAIPPIELPDISGIGIEFVPPGLTVLKESDQNVALGIFLRLALAASGGAVAPVQLAINSVNVEQRFEGDIQQYISTRLATGEPVGWRTLAPYVEVDLSVYGEGVTAANAEFAYRINGGLWSFWRPGSPLAIDDPVLAREGRHKIEVRARRAGDGLTTSPVFEDFEVVTDYTAPEIRVDADGTVATVVVSDNVTHRDQLDVQYRVNSGAWSRLSASNNDIDLYGFLGEAVTVEVRAADESGNVRTVEARVDVNDGAAADADGSFTTAGGAQTGCSVNGSPATGTGVGVVALMLGGLLLLRRRRTSARALGLVALAATFAVAGGTGCKKSPPPDPGGECGPDEYLDPIGICRPLICGTDADCPGSTNVCIDGSCVRCEAIAVPCGDFDCPADAISEIVGDPDQAYCAGIREPECACEFFGPLNRGDIGPWLDMTTAGENEDVVVASVYNLTYGDLMVGVLDGNGTMQWDFVDGVPTGATVEGLIAGPRGGIAAPGPVAGRYSSIASTFEAGETAIHVAYQYENSTLRYARGVLSGSGDWSWSYIDVDDDAVAGAYTRIFVDEDNGGVGIVYLADGVRNDTVVPTEWYSELRLAYASTFQAADAEDFVISVIDAQESGEPCAATCAFGDVCVAATGECAPAARGCSCDNAADLCATVDGAPTCVAGTTRNAGAPRGLPRAVGMFSDARMVSATELYVAYYDGVFGNLKGARVDVTTGAVLSSGILDGEIQQGPNRVDTGDIGHWPNVLVTAGGQIIVTYFDNSRGELKAINVNSSTIRTLDNGYRANPEQTVVSLNRVGANPTAVETDEGVVVTYQDTTTARVLELVWANTGANPADAPVVIMGDDEGQLGGYGFFARQLNTVLGRVVGTAHIINGIPGQNRRDVEVMFR